ncbi:glycoside hydrolase family 99-like domain-containing protein [uncultured Shimia sp.]|uniref:glycosyltransferase WbsX family protein n=1 Tax=uncultured Shimia sp. TaxID=573152 RepID=UPI0026080013|nr:glycoside hydrolase family 99-like domain-containing protein [uncultured Shimia sp.]
MSITNYITFMLLSGLARLSPPLPTRMTRRFRNSANKRDPRRTFHVHEQQVTSQERGYVAADLVADFVEYAPPPPFDPKVKLIAHYLPQFHPVEENDEWWGKGFTEWTNVGKAVPNYPGHYQPHCPIHLGYYDLRLPEIMEEQAKIAKAYGIGGFSYYFYWFGGKTLLERPLQQMLQRPEIDMPFCLNWANENWTRRWDGSEHDVLISQDHSIADSVAMLRHVRPYMEDPRYITIDGKPVFIVYRANIIPDICAITEAWRAEAKRWGLPGLYLIAVQSFDIKDPGVLGFDATCEFPPHQARRKDITDNMQVFNPDFAGAIYDYGTMIAGSKAQREKDYKCFRSVVLSWDNTARNQNAARIFERFSISAYKDWLTTLCRQVLHQPKYTEDEKIVFINAWNEWAEGTHLEPDRKYGFAYLQATADAVRTAEECSQTNSASTQPGL